MDDVTCSSCAPSSSTPISFFFFYLQLHDFQAQIQSNANPDISKIPPFQGLSVKLSSLSDSPTLLTRSGIFQLANHPSQLQDHRHYLIKLPDNAANDYYVPTPPLRSCQHLRCSSAVQAKLFQCIKQGSSLRVRACAFIVVGAGHEF